VSIGDAGGTAKLALWLCECLEVLEEEALDAFFSFPNL
jgi:hypothetical protein